MRARKGSVSRDGPSCSAASCFSASSSAPCFPDQSRCAARQNGHVTLASRCGGRRGATRAPAAAPIPPSAASARSGAARGRHPWRRPSTRCCRSSPAPRASRSQPRQRAFQRSPTLWRSRPFSRPMADLYEPGTLVAGEAFQTTFRFFVGLRRVVVTMQFEAGDDVVAAAEEYAAVARPRPPCVPLMTVHCLFQVL